MTKQLTEKEIKSLQRAQNAIGDILIAQVKKPASKRGRRIDKFKQYADQVHKHRTWFKPDYLKAKH